MKKERNLNGYRLVYEPDHLSSMTSKNWNGWIYEHILVAEEIMGRQLLENEEVHHLDGYRDNNDPSNLLVLYKCQHAKLHSWLRKGTYKGEAVEMAELEITEPRPRRSCEVCNNPLTKGQKKYCSVECSSFSSRKVKRPPPEELAILMKTESWLAMGERYGVSDNTVRQWARKYQLL